MKVKKTVLLLLFLVISTISTSQEYKKEIRKEFSRYLEAIISKDFKKSMEYVVPEFFEIFPKELMIKTMDKIFNDPSIEFEFKNPKILGIENAEKIEKKYYSFMTYSNQMNMRAKVEEEETEDEKKMRINLTKLSFEEAFGSENVSYNKKTGFFEVLVKKEAYAVSNNGKDEWKFLVLDKDQKMILKKLLPKKLSDKL